jgi:hypothetical protein
VALKLIGPYGIPLRSLISRHVPNLAMAGRNSSVTHAALGTVRVMATCGLMGQAIGTAAAYALRTGASLRQVSEAFAPAIQQSLLRDGCFLPNHRNADPDDLARSATASALSEASFDGLGRWDEVEDRNLRERVWTSGLDHETCLSMTPCQWFQAAGGRINRIGVALRNPGKARITATARLRRVESVWDYEAGGAAPVWEGTLEVPPRFDAMLPLETGLEGLEDGCYRLELAGPEGAFWRCSPNHAHGVAGGHIVGSGRFHWNRLHGEMALQIDPPQPVFGAAQALSGLTRPGDGTNLWLSDPARSLPQWFELSWDAPADVSAVELTFPSQLVLETHWENPFYVAPHIARNYQLQAWKDGAWQTIHTERDNTAARRRHLLPESIRTDHLRLLVEATHGSRSAGLAEIRCYS